MTKILVFLGFVVFALAGFGLWQWARGNVPSTNDGAPIEAAASVPTPNNNFYRVMDSVDKVTTATENGYTRTINMIGTVAITVLGTIVLIVFLAVFRLGRSKIAIVGVTNFAAGTKTNLLAYAGDRSDKLPLEAIRTAGRIANQAIPTDHLLDD